MTVFGGDSEQFVPWVPMARGNLTLPWDFAFPVVWITYVLLAPQRRPHDDGEGTYTGGWDLSPLVVPISLN